MLRIGKSHYNKIIIIYIFKPIIYLNIVKIQFLRAVLGAGEEYRKMDVASFFLIQTCWCDQAKSGCSVEVSWDDFIFLACNNPRRTVLQPPPDRACLPLHVVDVTTASR